MKMRSTIFTTTLTTPVFCPFLEENLFCNLITQSQNPAQVKTPNCAAETRMCSHKWYKNIGTKDALLTARSQVYWMGVLSLWLS